MADVADRPESKESFANQRNALPAKRKNLSSSDYIVRRRQPFAAQRKRDKHVFVTNKTNFKAQLRKCEKLLNNDASEVIIHALGAAIHKACSLALQLKEIHYSSLELDIKTSTVSLFGTRSLYYTATSDEIQNKPSVQSFNDTLYHLNLELTSPGAFSFLHLQPLT